MKTNYLSAPVNVLDASPVIIAAGDSRSPAISQKETKRTKRTKASRAGFTFILTVFLGAWATTEIDAQIIVAPNALATNDANSSATAPPGGPTSVREMQIFDASQFAALSGASFLTQFAYRPDMIPDASGPRSVNLQIYATTTTRSVAGLSMTFADNLGADKTLVFSGTLNWATENLPGPGNTRQFDVVFPCTTPFLYDPAAGNLLLEMQLSGNGPSITFDAEVGNPTARTRKIVNITSSNAATAAFVAPAQVIQFTFFRAILSVRLTEANSLLISWPAPSTGFELQQNDGLDPDTWMAVGTVPATVGFEKQVLVPSPAGNQFFRLRRP